MTQITRRRLSLFSFGSKDSNLDHSVQLPISPPPSQSQPSSQPSSQSQSQLSSQPLSQSQPELKPQPPKLPGKSTPVDQETDEVGSNQSAEESDDLNIFERSVQDQIQISPFQPPSQLSSRRPTMTKLKSRTSSISLSTFKSEDYVPPALDATTSLINDSKTNLDDVEMIYSSRRNSSVMGLNMALGRPPSRKNSVYSMSQFNMNSCNCNHNHNHHHFQNQNQPPININNNVPTLNTNNVNPSTLNSSAMSNSTSNQHPISPTSPPKLTTSKSSISFYSYADLLNNDEYAKRPNFKSSYSQGIIPTRKNSFGSKYTGSPNLNNNNNRRFNSSLNKFLISPESSDSEDDKRDNESFVSSSVGDFIKTSTAELNNS